MCDVIRPLTFRMGEEVIRNVSKAGRSRIDKNSQFSLLNGINVLEKSLAIVVEVFAGRNAYTTLFF